MLSSHAKQTLKKIAHALKPIIHVGKKALSESLHSEIDAALLAHELIKIKLNESATENQEELIQNICATQQAELIQVTGHIATIYRPHPQKPRIRLMQ